MTISRHQAAQYRTARFCSVALALKADLPQSPVSVTYLRHVRNEFKMRDEALFLCYRSPDKTADSFLGHFYEGAFTDFST